MHNPNIRLPVGVAAFLAAFLYALTPALAAQAGIDGVYRPGEFAGKRVAVVTGTVYGEVLKNHIPDAIPAYFTGKHDAYAALDFGKVDAVLDGENSSIMYRRKFPKLRILQPRLTNVGVGIAFRKGNSALRDEFNAFIEEIKADGTYDDIIRRWLVLPVPPPMPDIPTPGGRGSLAFGTAGITDGFSYFDKGEIVGIDIELAKRFANKTGRSLEVVTTDFGALIPAVQTGKLDFAANNFAITPERLKNVDFSNPYFETGGALSIIPTAESAQAEDDAAPIFRPGDFAGKTIGIATGVIFDQTIAKHIPSARVAYFQSTTDHLQALRAGKVDAVMDEGAAIRVIAAKNPDIIPLLPFVTPDEYAIVVAKGNDPLKRELDAFIAQIKADGTYDDMARHWLDTAVPPPMPAIKPGAGPRKLVLATSSLAEGFAYMRDGAPSGFDIEFAERFASSVGAKLDISVMDFGAIFPAIQSGKADFGAHLITITEERKKNVLFSEPYFTGGACIAVARHTLNPSGNTEAADDAPFWTWGSLKRSFSQNLLTEDRWQLILRGLAVTLLIAVAAFILGTAIGFVVCYCNMSGNALLRALGRAYVVLLRGTPIVVLLMIIYYVVFAKVNINSVIVAVIAYGLNAGAYIGEIIRSAILTVDKGQVEAARSMGFSRSGAFLTVTLPQAARVALPVYKSEFVSLIKSTAVVGYIAVVDLTKAGDIIRSRTYDAFFPLLTVALIYLVTAGLVVWCFDWVGRRTDRRERRTKQ